MATVATETLLHLSRNAERLLGELGRCRAETDRLFGVVREQALYDRPIAERHRIVFYIGHLEAFDHNLLASALGLEPFNPAFDKLFAFGIDPVDGGLPSDQPSDWPRLDEVWNYVHRVRERLDAALAAPGVADAYRTLLHVATEHRWMHVETLAYMFHRLPYESKIAQPEPPVPKAPPHAARMIEIPAGRATLGLRRNDADAFGWCNEYDEHTVDVPAFAIDAFKVTNGEFLEFMRAGGYEDKKWWSEADWNWTESEGIWHPSFWIRSGTDWYFRGMFEESPLALDWPVYVSQAEASAYARWAGKALPTEAEFHRAAYGAPGTGDERPYPWGHEAPADRFGNFDLHRWNPVPTGAHPAGRSAFGVEDLVGNGWEWTSTVFAPFAGFEAFSFYPGYSANFFDGKHYVMKGGSMRTAAPLLRRSFRNWFQAHYPFVYAGFRCVKH